MHPILPGNKWNGWGFEYKSEANFLGFPLLHVSFKYRPNRIPVVAKGVIFIGQFGCGIINISRFGIGLISIIKFTIAGFSLAQFAFAWKLIAQIWISIEEGRRQLVRSLEEVNHPAYKAGRLGKALISGCSTHIISIPASVQSCQRFLRLLILLINLSYLVNIIA